MSILLIDEDTLYNKLRPYVSFDALDDIIEELKEYSADINGGLTLEEEEIIEDIIDRRLGDNK